jgi:GNAT superfamily N-acetyltransferase
MSDEITIRHDLQPGDLGRIIGLHGKLYDDLPGFGLKFEAFVAQTLAEYILEANGDGRIWQVERDGRLIGCTAIVLRDNDVGQLRWVLLDPSARGTGLGKRLVNTALQYCRDNCCVSVVLETTDGLPESQTLYESLGFEVTSEEPAELWDDTRLLIKMALRIS